MAEQLKRDQNHVTVQGAVTDDSNQTVEMWRADATTKRLLVSAVVAGSQNGKILVDGADTTYEYLATKLVAGTGITLTVINPGGNETLEISSVGSIYYNIVQEDGVSVTQRTKLNFVNYFSINDNAGNTSTDVNLNIGAIESALDLANIGGQINLATQVTGLLSSTNIDITDLESNLNLSNISGSIDLSTQVTGTLDVANIDVVGIANDATFLATLIPNLDENVKVAVDGVTITGDGTTGNPLVAAVSSDNFTVKATSADTTPSYLDNKLNIHSTDGSVTVTKTITNPAGNEVVDYDLSTTGGTGNITSGSELYLGVAYNDSSSYNMAITFGNYVISAYKNASNVYVTTTQLRNSHGGYEVVPNFVEWAGGTGVGGGNGALYKSEDGLYLYSAKINVLPASVYELVVTKYDTTGTLLNTYTTTGGPFIIVPEAMALIVIGTKILVSMFYSATPITTAFWTEFTISGATLVSPTTTNIPLVTNNLYYGAYDGTNIYIGTGSSIIAPYDPLNADVQKASYTSPNQTILSTFTMPNTVFTTSNSTQKVWNNGFNIEGTKIGLYKNTSDTSGVSTSQSIVSKTIYQEYTF